MVILEMFIGDEKVNGVSAFSLVNDPAMESEFVKLNKQHEIKLKVIDKKKRLLMGVAMIPNKLILRHDFAGHEECRIFFSAESIRQIMYLFFQKSFQNNTTLEHMIPLEKNTIVESWIKEDETHDKSVKFGIEAPVGSWIVSMKVEDDDLWELAEKGELTGFSIEGLFDNQLINQSKNVTKNDKFNYNNMSNVILDKIKEVKKLLLDKEPVELATEKLDNGTVLEAESFEAGQPVFIVQEDERVPLPVGEYEFAGKMLVVAEEGIIGEIKEGAMEEEEVEAESDFVTKEEFNAFVDEIKSMLSKDTGLSKEEVKEDEVELSEEQKELAQLKLDAIEVAKEKKILEDKNIELQKEIDETPDATTIKHAPAVITEMKATNKKERLMQKIHQLKAI